MTEDYVEPDNQSTGSSPPLYDIDEGKAAGNVADAFTIGGNKLSSDQVDLINCISSDNAKEFSEQYLELARTLLFDLKVLVLPVRSFITIHM